MRARDYIIKSLNTPEPRESDYGVKLSSTVGRNVTPTPLGQLSQPRDGRRVTLLPPPDMVERARADRGRPSLLAPAALVAPAASTAPSPDAPHDTAAVPTDRGRAGVKSPALGGSLAQDQRQRELLKAIELIQTALLEQEALVPKEVLRTLLVRIGDEGSPTAKREAADALVASAQRGRTPAVAARLREATALPAIGRQAHDATPPALASPAPAARGAKTVGMPSERLRPASRAKSVTPQASAVERSHSRRAARASYSSPLIQPSDDAESADQHAPDDKGRGHSISHHQQAETGALALATAAIDAVSNRVGVMYGLRRSAERIDGLLHVLEGAPRRMGSLWRDSSIDAEIEATATKASLAAAAASNEWREVVESLSAECARQRRRIDELQQSVAHLASAANDAATVPELRAQVAALAQAKLDLEAKLAAQSESHELQMEESRAAIRRARRQAKAGGAAQKGRRGHRHPRRSHDTVLSDHSVIAGGMFAVEPASASSTESSTSDGAASDSDAVDSGNGSPRSAGDDAESNTTNLLDARAMLGASDMSLGALSSARSAHPNPSRRGTKAGISAVASSRSDDGATTFLTLPPAQAATAAASAESVLSDANNSPTGPLLHAGGGRGDSLLGAVSSDATSSGTQSPRKAMLAATTTLTDRERRKRKLRAAVLVASLAGGVASMRRDSIRPASLLNAHKRAPKTSDWALGASDGKLNADVAPVWAGSPFDCRYWMTRLLAIGPGGEPAEVQVPSFDEMGMVQVYRKSGNIARSVARLTTVVCGSIQDQRKLKEVVSNVVWAPFARQVLALVLECLHSAGAPAESLPVGAATTLSAVSSPNATVAAAVVGGGDGAAGPLAVPMLVDWDAQTASFTAIFPDPCAAAHFALVLLERAGTRQWPSDVVDLALRAGLGVEDASAAADFADLEISGVDVAGRALATQQQRPSSEGAGTDSRPPSSPLFKRGERRHTMPVLGSWSGPLFRIGMECGPVSLCCDPGSWSGIGCSGATVNAAIVFRYVAFGGSIVTSAAGWEAIDAATSVYLQQQQADDAAMSGLLSSGGGGASGNRFLFPQPELVSRPHTALASITSRVELQVFVPRSLEPRLEFIRAIMEADGPAASALGGVAGEAPTALEKLLDCVPRRATAFTPIRTAEGYVESTLLAPAAPDYEDPPPRTAMPSGYGCFVGLRIRSHDLPPYSAVEARIARSVLSTVEDNVRQLTARHSGTVLAWRTGPSLNEVCGDANPYATAHIADAVLVVLDRASRINAVRRATALAHAIDAELLQLVEWGTLEGGAYMERGAPAFAWRGTVAHRGPRIGIGIASPSCVQNPAYDPVRRVARLQAPEAVTAMRLARLAAPGVTLVAHDLPPLLATQTGSIMRQFFAPVSLPAFSTSHSVVMRTWATVPPQGIGRVFCNASRHSHLCLPPALTPVAASGGSTSHPTTPQAAGLATPTRGGSRPPAAAGRPLFGSHTLPSALRWGAPRLHPHATRLLRRAVIAHTRAWQRAAVCVDLVESDSGRREYMAALLRLALVLSRRLHMDADPERTQRQLEGVEAACMSALDPMNDWATTSEDPIRIGTNAAASMDVTLGVLDLRTLQEVLVAEAKPRRARGASGALSARRSRTGPNARQSIARSPGRGGPGVGGPALAAVSSFSAFSEDDLDSVRSSLVSGGGRRNSGGRIVPPPVFTPSTSASMRRSTMKK